MHIDCRTREHGIAPISNGEELGRDEQANSASAFHDARERLPHGPRKHTDQRTPFSLANLLGSVPGGVLLLRLRFFFLHEHGPSDEGPVGAAEALRVLPDCVPEAALLRHLQEDAEAQAATGVILDRGFLRQGYLCPHPNLSFNNSLTRARGVNYSHGHHERRKNKQLS